MPFGQISTHPLRQTLLDLSNKPENMDQLVDGYAPDLSWFSGQYRGVDISHLKIDACNKYEAVVLFYDYINMNSTYDGDVFEENNESFEDVFDQTNTDRYIDNLFMEFTVTLSNSHVLK